jgi:1,4-alpha-glucan branching enzyme
MYMSERFGAWQVGNDPAGGAVEFRIFFPDRNRDPHQYHPDPVQDAHVEGYGEPNIASIQVAGDFQQELAQDNWDFAAAPFMTQTPHPKGWIWTYRTTSELPAGFYQYKYYATFDDGSTRKVGDPCARYGGSEYQNSGVVVGGSQPQENEVMPLAGGRQHLRDLVLYELMIDDFTDEFRGSRAPIDAVRDKLDYLHDLGINAILFMPWTAWPGEDFNWGYTPFQYFSVEHRYVNAPGRPEEKLSWLKLLISECHQRGIHVIMDGVFNHAGDVEPLGDLAYGFPYRWLYQDPRACPYVGSFGGTFQGLLDLDFHNGCTQEFIRDVCLYWIDTFKIDGIRFDNTVNFYVEGVEGGLPRLLREIREHTEANGQENFSLVLEHISLNAASVTNATAATSYWDDGFRQCCFDYLQNWYIDPRIMPVLNTHKWLNYSDKVATTYIANHDHAHVAWQAGNRSNKGSCEWYRTQPYAIALFTCPGAPMIQNGQEFAEDYWVVENDEGSNRRVQPRPLHWSFVNDPFGRKLVALYRKLIELRKSHPALRTDNFYPDDWQMWQTQFNPQGYGVDVAKQVVIFHRWGDVKDGGLERFIIVLNLSGEDQQVDIPFPADGQWHELLNDRYDIVIDSHLQAQWIESNWGRIYYQKVENTLSDP